MVGDDSHPPRVGVGCLVVRDGRVLLIHRRGAHEAGTWSTPGGHLERGETPAACATRETREETGVVVGALRFVGVTNDVFRDSGKHYVTLWLKAGSASGEARACAPDEVGEVGWFAFDELPRPLFLPLANLLAGRSEPPDAFRRTS